MAKWNKKTKGKGLIVEENGTKVRMTLDHTWRNIISEKGYSKGIHEWIFEFGRGDEGSGYGSGGWWCSVVRPRALDPSSSVRNSEA